MKKLWTEEEEYQLLNLRAEGKTFKEIAEILGISISAVKMKYYRLINSPKKPKVKNVAAVLRKKKRINEFFKEVIKVAREGMNNPTTAYFSLLDMLHPIVCDCGNFKDFLVTDSNGRALIFKCLKCGKSVM